MVEEETRSQLASDPTWTPVGLFFDETLDPVTEYQAKAVFLTKRFRKLGWGSTRSVE